MCNSSSLTMKVSLPWKKVRAKAWLNNHLVITETVSLLPVILDPLRPPVLAPGRLASVAVRAKLSSRLDDRVVQSGLDGRSVTRPSCRKNQNEQVAKNSADVKCHFCKVTVSRVPGKGCGPPNVMSL